MSISVNEFASGLAIIAGCAGAFFGAYVKMKGNAQHSPQKNVYFGGCTFSQEHSSQKFEKLRDDLISEVRDLRNYIHLLHKNN